MCGGEIWVCCEGCAWGVSVINVFVYCVMLLDSRNVTGAVVQK